MGAAWEVFLVQGHSQAVGLRLQPSQGSTGAGKSAPKLTQGVVGPLSSSVPVGWRP